MTKRAGLNALAVAAEKTNKHDAEKSLNRLHGCNFFMSGSTIVVRCDFPSDGKNS